VADANEVRHLQLKARLLNRRVRVLGTLEVRVDHVPVAVGVLHFRVELVPRGGRTKTLAEPLGDTAQQTESVFISYASEDRAVLRRVQGIKALGIRFFQDILSLSPGERWEMALWHHIHESSMFLLCWSSAARQSKWVHDEYRRACEVYGKSPNQRPHITVLPLEGPPPPKPWSDLAHLNLSDNLLYALLVEGDRAAKKSLRSRPSPLVSIAVKSFPAFRNEHVGWIVTWKDWVVNFFRRAHEVECIARHRAYGG